jgi:chromate transport protein ChrA
MQGSVEATDQPAATLAMLVRYFVRLGTTGFGGPAALVGYMRRDLVEDRQWIDEDTYNLAIALAQIMPGPLAAQTAIAIGYFHSGLRGATLVGLAFIAPSFLMVLGLSWLYVRFGGLPVVQSLFYGIGAVVIAIIAMAAYRLARGTNKRDPLLWGVFVVLFVGTVWTGAELAGLFLLAGVVLIVARAWPGARQGSLIIGGALVLGGIAGSRGEWNTSYSVPMPVACNRCRCKSCCSSRKRAHSSSGAASRSCRSCNRALCTISAGSMSISSLMPWRSR